MNKDYTHMINWRTSIEFCPNVGQCTSSKIASLVSRKILKGDALNELVSFYDEMRKDYGRARSLFQFLATEAFKDQSIKEFLYKCTNVGHDLPVWVRKKGTNGTKIAIVAQDPFRSNFGSGKMVLSTPFGLHSPVCERNNEMFYRLIESLLMEEATVYVTDCKKACCGIPSGTSDKCGRCKEVDCENYRSTDVAKKFQEYLCADDILNDEINMFGPDVIIALGKVATQTLFPRFPIGGFKKYALSCWAIENQYAREDVKWAWSLLHPSRKNYHYFKNSGRATNIGAIEKKVYRYYQKAAKRIVSKAKGVD